MNEKEVKERFDELTKQSPSNHFVLTALCIIAVLLAELIESIKTKKKIW